MSNVNFSLNTMLYTPYGYMVSSICHVKCLPPDKAFSHLPRFNLKNSPKGICEMLVQEEQYINHLRIVCWYFKSIYMVHIDYPPPKIIPFWNFSVLGVIAPSNGNTFIQILFMIFLMVVITSKHHSSAHKISP